MSKGRGNKGNHLGMAILNINVETNNAVFLTMKMWYISPFPPQNLPLKVLFVLKCEGGLLGLTLGRKFSNNLPTRVRMNEKSLWPFALVGLAPGLISKSPPGITKSGATL